MPTLILFGRTMQVRRHRPFEDVEQGLSSLQAEEGSRRQERRHENKDGDGKTGAQQLPRRSRRSRQARPRAHHSRCRRAHDKPLLRHVAAGQSLRPLATGERLRRAGHELQQLHEAPVPGRHPKIRRPAAYSQEHVERGLEWSKGYLVFTMSTPRSRVGRWKVGFTLDSLFNDHTFVNL